MGKESEHEPERREQATGAGASTLSIALCPFPVLRVDAAGVVTDSNGVLERELGVREPLRGRPLASLVDAGMRATAAGLAAGRLRQPLRVRLRFVPGEADGRERTFEAVPAGSALWLMGQPLECDIQREALERVERRADVEADELARVSQELRRAEELLAQRTRALTDATEAKTRFLATMSHELRTPLNAILGYAGLLRDGVYGGITGPQERAVRSIVRRAQDLQLLIDDVLDFSRIETGRADVRVDHFDPATVVAEVKEAIAPLARDKHLTVTVRTNIRDEVHLDRAKYKQIVLHLATNAVKFTPARGEVELSVEQAGHRRFLTRVRDTGIGIAREHLQRIFENFQQLDGGTTRRFEGLGLGLAMVRRIVELLDGTIEIDSAPGHGTTVCVALPIRPDPEALLGNPEPTLASEKLVDDPVIVAIDNDPEVIALLSDSLAPAHFRVVGALTGDRGLELARILRPLAITLDIMMPEKDGWQVLREIRADAALAGIPVIVLSVASERAIGASLGATEYLVKPVDRRVLIDVLERLRNHAPPRSTVAADGGTEPRPRDGAP